MKSKKIDITDTFIDGNETSTEKAPKQINLFDVEDIHTYRDYNTKLIELLTLLTNCSMPCQDSSGSVRVY